MLNYNSEMLTIKLAKHLLENKSTIRATAQNFNMAKSTVHHMLSTHLKRIDKNLYNQVKNLLTENFNNKHIHGGEATKMKYKQLKKEINHNDKYEFCLD